MDLMLSIVAVAGGILVDAGFVAVGAFAVRRTKTAASVLLLLTALAALVGGIVELVIVPTGTVGGMDEAQARLYAHGARLVAVAGRGGFALGLWWLIQRLFQAPGAVAAASAASPQEPAAP
ncbi:MAG: hypothetical protein H6733_06920 [Alphaproteobacteria bacterium]|nr:hypothetical protein [Alphaproteobacteria bacterium]